MILYPSIDIKDTLAVQLEGGDINRPRTISRDPSFLAEDFVHDGAQWLHIVDLNGAVEGRVINAAAVSRIIERVPETKIQLGGGIRSVDMVSRWLDLGVARVVIGTAALRDPQMVRDACNKWPGRVAVSIDARNGAVAVSGWTKTTATTAEELARAMADTGVAALVYTDVGRDGTLQGANLDAALGLAATAPLPVIIGGGIASLAELKKIKDAEIRGIAGVVCGRALYERIFTIRDALEILDGKTKDAAPKN